MGWERLGDERRKVKELLLNISAFPGKQKAHWGGRLSLEELLGERKTQLPRTLRKTVFENMDS